MTGGFGALLRQLRLRAGMTQEQLEEQSGVSVRTIRRFETRDPFNGSMTTVRRLADALRLSAEERDGLLAAAAGTSAGENATAPVPRQLPAPPGEFVGRHDELAALDKAVGATPAVVAASGGGGIGKTWTALHWAHRNLDRFPDGQLFVDLHGFDPGGMPVRPATAVRGFLDALVKTGTPAGEDAQAALYRTLVADKRMLIVLDNARDAAQVVPLLPGGRGCTVLVTSRDRLAGLVTAHGAVPLALGELEEHEAWDVLAARLGRDRLAAEPDAAADLVRYCAGLPLALAVVAARAELRADVLLATLAAELRDVSTRLDALDAGDPTSSVHAALSWTYGALNSSQAETFALLGLTPGAEISLAAAANLVAEADVSATTRALERVSLIEQCAPRRYRMHDLVKLFAADQARTSFSAEIRDAALRRLSDFYLHTAHAADRLLEPHRHVVELGEPAPGTSPRSLPDPAAALTWFDDEHANLLAAQRIATARGWHDTVWQLAWSLNTFQSRRGLVHDRLAVWRAALDAATSLADPGPLMRVHRLLGYASAALGHHEEAIGNLGQAVGIAEQEGDLAELGRAHVTLARVWEMRGDVRRAREHGIQALHIFRALEQPVWEAEALNSIGWQSACLGEYETAREHCQAAHALYREHHERDGEADTLDSLGYIAHLTGRHDEAVGHYQQALTLFKDIGYTHTAADTLERLGHPYAALGQCDRAWTVWSEALAMYQTQHRTTDAQRVRAALDRLDTDLSGTTGT
ncbi:tetratricopeptide repeat protein [Lentzea sp. NPDC051838]|uniref:ATP-binding protein n=1 Tax=Lentzea sp. NPDC051838 TaxID=3154849 RepID=UPI00342D2765